MWLSCAFKSPTTAGLIHNPRFVALNQSVENLRSR
jgi:hypothetical protein